MTNKNRNYTKLNDYDDEYEDDYRKPKKKDSPIRREVLNWKKAWSNNQDRYDEVDDFYSK
jgi:hypothetical protein